MRAHTLHLALALAMLTGCADAFEAADAAVSAEAPVAVMTAETAAEPPLTAWQDWLGAALAQAERDQPATVADLRAATPVATRAGHPRFTSAALDQPVAAVVLLDRLSRGTDPAPVRAALAEALPRTGGAYASALVGLAAHETDAEVRVAIISALRRAATEPALAGLRAGLADTDARVRAAAAEVASRRPDGATLGDLLIARLDDDAAEVQVAVARSLGALRVADAFPALQAHLSQGTAELRLHSLRALGRIDAARASSLPELAALRRDPDARVAEAAARLTARQP